MPCVQQAAYLLDSRVTPGEVIRDGCVHLPPDQQMRTNKPLDAIHLGNAVGSSVVTGVQNYSNASSDRAWATLVTAKIPTFCVD
jgi:hypothetical protein